ncbi:MAG: DUF47 family protein [Deltaproteobacteria bacterium]|nr:DUF47 family protein [Deltaproteobacteria bacterium]
MGLQDILRFLLPKEDHFYDFLEKQAEVAHQGALALAAFANDEVGAAETATRLRDAEHEGDRLEHQMEEALSLTFVTPIDREDLHRLSSELDSILDSTNHAVQACVMMGVAQPTEPMRKLARLIATCTERVAATVPKLRRHDYAAIVEDARDLRKLEKEGDVIFREAIRDLFSEAVGGGPAHTGAADARVLIREKTVLQDLEDAIDACDEIADTLTNLAIKHG